MFALYELAMWKRFDGANVCANLLISHFKNWAQICLNVHICRIALSIYVNINITVCLICKWHGSINSHLTKADWMKLTQRCKYICWFVVQVRNLCYMVSRREKLKLLQSKAQEQMFNLHVTLVNQELSAGETFIALAVRLSIRAET